MEMILVLYLVIIIILLISQCIKERRRRRRLRRAQKKIPTWKFSKGNPYHTCAICLDDYQEGDRLRALPCAHAFHTVCIDFWLRQNKFACALCKRRVFTDRERRCVLSDSELLLTQGSTFDEQRENPFVRAARFMSRLRASMDHSAEARTENNDKTNNVNENTVEAGDCDLPLPITPALAALSDVSEWRTRRSRRVPSASEPVAQLISDSHSINTETRGEIGVAALPAQQSSSTPHHLDL